MGVPFPPIFVINLKNRKDRMTHINKDFFDWPIQPERVDAIIRKPGSTGLALTFKKCIQMAKDRKYPWVLVLEDDCKLEKDALKRFQTILHFLWDRTDWDIFNGGPRVLKRDHTLISKKIPILKITGYVAAQFILVSSRAYSKILSEILIKDPILMRPLAIDIYFSDYLSTFVTYPHLAVQRNGYSNLNKKNRNLNKTFTLSNRTLKKFLNTHKNRVTQKKRKSSHS
jgi:GR25 family glycosyltransferase involved in LPS biosynthesis